MTSNNTNIFVVPVGTQFHENDHGVIPKQTSTLNVDSSAIHQNHHHSAIATTSKKLPPSTVNNTTKSGVHETASTSIRCGTQQEGVGLPEKNLRELFSLRSELSRKVEALKNAVVIETNLVNRGHRNKVSSSGNLNAVNNSTSNNYNNNTNNIKILISPQNRNSNGNVNSNNDDSDNNNNSSHQPSPSIATATPTTTTSPLEVAASSPSAGNEKKCCITASTDGSTTTAPSNISSSNADNNKHASSYSSSSSSSSLKERVFAAVLTEDAEYLHSLLSEGADPNYRDYRNRTPLHVACFTGNLACVELLLEFGADIAAVDDKNQTAREVALFHNHQSVVATLDPSHVESLLCEAVPPASFAMGGGGWGGNFGTMSQFGVDTPAHSFEQLHHQQDEMSNNNNNNNNDNDNNNNNQTQQPASNSTSFNPSSSSLVNVNINHLVSGNIQGKSDQDVKNSISIGESKNGATSVHVIIPSSSSAASSQLQQSPVDQQQQQQQQYQQSSFFLRPQPPPPAHPNFFSLPPAPNNANYNHNTSTPVVSPNSFVMTGNNIHNNNNSNNNSSTNNTSNSNLSDQFFLFQQQQQNEQQQQIQQSTQPIYTVWEKRNQPSAFRAVGDTDSVVVCMVGLPGRGKSFLSKNCARFLRWKGVPTRVFNAGDYRRRILGVEGTRGASFYDKDNTKAKEQRELMAQMACQDAAAFIKSQPVAVAFIDATNTNRARRQWLLDFFCPHIVSQSRILFIESVCDDDEIITQSILRDKVTNGDYDNIPVQQVVQDFHARIEKYREQYEPVDPVVDEKLCFLKIINLKETLLANRITGRLQTLISAFITNLHPVAHSLYLIVPGPYSEVDGVTGASSNHIGAEPAVMPTLRDRHGDIPQTILSSSNVASNVELEILGQQIAGFVREKVDRTKNALENEKKRFFLQEEEAKNASFENTNGNNNNNNNNDNVVIPTPASPTVLTKSSQGSFLFEEEENKFLIAHADDASCEKTAAAIRRQLIKYQSDEGWNILSNHLRGDQEENDENSDKEVGQQHQQQQQQQQKTQGRHSPAGSSVYVDIQIDTVQWLQAMSYGLCEGMTIEEASKEYPKTIPFAFQPYTAEPVARSEKEIVGPDAMDFLQKHHVPKQLQNQNSAADSIETTTHNKPSPTSANGNNNNPTTTTTPAGSVTTTTTTPPSAPGGAAAAAAAVSIGIIPTTQQEMMSTYVTGYPKGESLRQVAVRVSNMVMQWKRTDSPLLCVCSVAPATLLVAFAADLPPEAAAQLRLPRNTIIEITAKHAVVLRTLLKYEAESAKLL